MTGSKPECLINQPWVAFSILESQRTNRTAFMFYLKQENLHLSKLDGTRHTAVIGARETPSSAQFTLQLPAAAAGFAIIKASASSAYCDATTLNCGR